MTPAPLSPLGEEMETMQYTTENTEGYSSEDLETMNRIYEHRIAHLDESERENADLLQHVSEQVLEDCLWGLERVPDQINMYGEYDLQVVRIRDLRLIDDGAIALLDVQARDGLQYEGRLVIINPDGTTITARGEPRERLLSDDEMVGDCSDMWSSEEPPAGGFAPCYEDYPVQTIGYNEGAIDAYAQWLGERIRSCDLSGLSSTPIEDVEDLLEEVRRLIAYKGVLAGTRAISPVGSSADWYRAALSGGYPGGDTMRNGLHYGLIQQAYYYGWCETTPGFGFDDAYSALAVEIETGRSARVYWRMREDYDPEMQEEDDACDWDHADHVEVWDE